MARSRDRRAVEALREYSDGASINIDFGPMAERPTARRIADLFELAGWTCSFADFAQDAQGGLPYREGIHVWGVTRHLVEHVADVLSSEGFPGVRTSIIDNRIAPSNPKYSHVVRAVHIHVGHRAQEPSMAPSRRRTVAMWLRSWLAPAVLVGLLSVVVTYLIAARVSDWWPF